MEDIEYNNTKVLLLGGEDKYTLGNFYSIKIYLQFLME